ncbi:hypothetical protein JW977_01810, partial [Candidatus Falkowbacteria bacterium]|nr:hypothetical protein [Candidatus Falkowbacteria bacterium]
MEIVLITIRNFWTTFKTSKELLFEKIIRLTIYLAVFFIPLICLPLNDSFVEYSKIILFYILVILGLLFWLLKLYYSKKIEFNFFILDIPIIIFVFIYLLSSLLSIDRLNSFLGFNFDVSHSFITILFLAVFYFLVSRFFDNLKNIKKLFILLNISIFLILLFNIVNSFCDLSILLLFNASANTLNFLLVLSVILGGVIFFSSNNQFERIFSLACALINITALYIFHNQIALLLLIISIFFFILFSSFKSQYFSNKVVVILTLLILLTVFALILPLNNLLNLSIPLELNLPNSFGWKITKNTLSDYMLLGVGPGNFSYSFYKYKPIEYNLSSLWQLGFEKNSNAWMEILNSIGILGILLLIILFIKYFWHFTKYIKKNELNDEYNNKLLLIIGLTVIILLFIIFGCFNNYVFANILLFSLFLALACNL